MEVEQRPEVEAPCGHRRRCGCQDSPQAQPASEELGGPKHGDAGAFEPAGTVEHQVGEQLVIERHCIWDLLDEEGADGLPGPGTPP